MWGSACGRVAIAAVLGIVCMARPRSRELSADSGNGPQTRGHVVAPPSGGPVYEVCSPPACPAAPRKRLSRKQRRSNSLMCKLKMATAPGGEDDHVSVYNLGVTTMHRLFGRRYQLSSSLPLRTRTRNNCKYAPIRRSLRERPCRSESRTRPDTPTPHHHHLHSHHATPTTPPKIDSLRGEVTAQTKLNVHHFSFNHRVCI